MNKKHLKILCAVLVLSLTLSLAGCGSDNDQIKVKTGTVKTGQLEGVATITGALVPVQAADLAAPFSGKVLEVYVASGDTVKQGQLLAKLDDSQLNTQYKQSVSTYQQMERAQAQARITLDNAAAALERTRKLYAEGAVAKIQVDADQKAYDLALSQSDSDASISAAKASVDSIRIQLGNAVIKSPFDGVVLSTNFSPGENAAMGSAVVSVGDMDTLKLKGTVAQESLPYIKIGDPVDLFIDIYPERVFTGTIDNVGSMSVSTGSYFPVEISYRNSDEVASGLSAHADIKIKGESHLIVPRSAVVTDGGKSSVFIIEDGIAMKRAIITGLQSDSEIEVLNGLDGTETVAISNANHLFDEMPVQIVKD